MWQEFGESLSWNLKNRSSTDRKKGGGLEEMAEPQNPWWAVAEKTACWRRRAHPCMPDLSCSDVITLGWCGGWASDHSGSLWSYSTLMLCLLLAFSSSSEKVINFLFCLGTPVLSLSPRCFKTTDEALTATEYHWLQECHSFFTLCF